MKRKNSLADSLKRLIDKANEQDVTIQQILTFLARRGQALLLVLCSLPFCQPFQIPGISTPFGILLAFIGLRIAFGHRVWLPKLLLNKKIPYASLKKIASLAITITDKLRFFISTRLVWLVQTPSLRILHGIVISLLALLLALPLPIPLTNVLAAYPILFFGMAFLEDDGLMIIIAYSLATLCLAAFIGLIWFGKEGIQLLLGMLAVIS